MLRFFTTHNAKKAATGAAFGAAYSGLTYATVKEQDRQTNALKKANPGYDVEWKYRCLPGVGSYLEPLLVKAEPEATPTKPTP